MPFEIIRGDITEIKADAIVNAANLNPVIGAGVDAGIHMKAGPKLLAARKKIGPIAVGQAAITPAFNMDARFVIHAVSPVWEGGEHGEEALLRQSYDRALTLAAKKRCKSVAFPLLSAGNYGFPKALALQIAINAFSAFLMEHEMQITLVVFNKDAFELSEKLFQSVKSYIDEHYIQQKLREEYAVADSDDVDRAIRERRQRRENAAMSETTVFDMPAAAPAPVRASAPAADLAQMLRKTDAGFSETLLKLIDRTGKKDAEIYKKANIDRKLFSKIRSNPAYKPSKATALAFAIALELDLDETRDFIGRAGYALSHSSKFDIIVEYFILQRNYNVMELNETLFAFDQPLIGG